MNSRRFNSRLSLASFIFIAILSAAPLAAAPEAAASATSQAAWGAKAAALDTDKSLEEMLRYAIEDEYLARAEYEGILKKFGSQRPFSNIIKSEESHISWLRDAYAVARLAVPKDEAAGHVAVPSTLKEAFATGVQAEVDNIAMYNAFLASGLVARTENKATRELFTHLRDASKNHLASFQNGLSRL